MAALSGVVVSQLGTGEQLLLWALRQRRADRGETGPILAHGFRLACGLCGVEAALERFERLCRALEGEGPCGVCPLRCAVLSADETRCIALVAAAQAGEAQAIRRLAAMLVGALRAPGLCEAARELAEELDRAGVRVAPPGRSVAVLH
ncbi:MAG: hypothetical protein AB7I59_29185 [Geminicoccaceae bacterium]